MELRCARHTNDLKSITDFYTEILGLELLFSFENHNGYNGIFLGKSGQSWHLEFTSSATQAVHTFDEEDLLVFYPTDQEEYNQIINRIDLNGIKKEKPVNPFWIENGVMIKDPDGFGVIVSNMKVN